MNPALGRLVLDHRCNAENVGDGTNGSYFLAPNPTNVGRFNDRQALLNQLARTTGRGSCAPDNAAFKRLINQWGFIVAPNANHSARTTGFGGFHFSIEGMYTKIDDGSDYWRLGSRGSRDPSNNQASVYNTGPPSVVQLYSVKARKSFGFGLELMTTVGFVPDSTILTGGADVRMSLLEGFRTGAMGILPDVAVGGGIRTITGTPEFQLTTVGLDVQISKPLTIASESVLTPFIGYQYLWIFGDSGLIDMTPATDPVGYCGFSGTNVPGNPDPNSSTYDGQPVCASGSPIDFNNNVVFDNARLERQRMMFGLNYRYEMVMVGTEFITDIINPADAQVGKDSIQVIENGKVKQLSDKDVLSGQPRQWSFVLELGTMF